MASIRPVAILVGCLAVWSGCSLLVPLDELGGGGGPGEGGAGAPADATAQDGPSADDSGGGPMPDGAVTDGPDGSADVMTVTDAPAEASPPPPFCASLSPAPVLCADFDEGGPFDAQFTTAPQSASSQVGADGASFESPPDSLFSSIDQGAAISDTYAFVSRTFAGTSTRIEYAFDILIEQEVSSHVAVAAAVLVDDGQPDWHELTFVIGASKEMEQSFATDAGNDYLDTPLSTFPMVGQWSHVDIVMSLAQRTMGVTIDGQAAITNAPLDPSWPTSGAVSIDLGITYADGTSGPWLVRYDDVVANPQ